MAIKTPYDPSMGQIIKTDIPGLSLDRAFLAHFKVAAGDAPATSNDAVHSAVNLDASEQPAITSGIVSPAVPRNILAKGNLSGVAGNVVITGTNYSGETITETIPLNGASAVEGNKAFKTVTNISLPAQTHTPTAQVETVVVATGASTAGTLVVRVTAAGITESPVDVNCAVVDTDDSAEDVAAKVISALAANDDVSGFFNVSGTGANVVLTAKGPAANDETLAITLQDADSTSVTFGESGSTTPGVPYDTVSIGWGDKLGLPVKLPHNTVFLNCLNGVRVENLATVGVDSSSIELNTVDMYSALDGSAVDVYLIL